MRLDHKSLEAKVERALRNLADIVLAAGHMARIHKERNLRIAAAELDRHLPLRIIAVFYLFEGRESSINNTKFLDTRTMKTLQCSDPKLEVRIDRILHEHRYIRIFQSISNFLHEERIRSGSCSEPYEIHSEFKALEDMLLAGHLGCDLQAVFLLCLLHPSQPLGADALE